MFLVRMRMFLVVSSSEPSVVVRFPVHFLRKGLYQYLRTSFVGTKFFVETSSFCTLLARQLSLSTIL